MKVAKFKKSKKEEKIIEQESYTLKGMAKILVILLIVFGSFYVLTVFLVKDRKVETNTPEVVLDSSKITLSQLLNREEEEYYVLATKSSLYESSYVNTDYIEFYNNYISEYKQNEDALTFYYVDLDNALNKKYFGEELNITDDVSELKINDEVLFKIKNKKIEKYYVVKDKILDKLSRL